MTDPKHRRSTNSNLQYACSGEACDSARVNVHKDQKLYIASAAEKSVSIEYHHLTDGSSKQATYNSSFDKDDNGMELVRNKVWIAELLKSLRSNINDDFVATSK